MVTGSDPKSRGEVVDDTPHGCLPMQRRPEGGDTADERDPNDQVDVEPVDMFVPIG